MKPTFNETEKNWVAREFALPLIGMQEEDFLPLGTATVVAPYLAMTAKHVTDEFSKQFQPYAKPNKTGTANYSIIALQSLDSGTKSAVWDVQKIYGIPETDIVFLFLRPQNEIAANHKWRIPKIDLRPPAIGTKVSAFGYCKSEIKSIKSTSDKVVVHLYDSPSTSDGIVTEVHGTRGRGFHSFPCFQINARLDSGMSGGPVLNNQSGEICGIVCSGLDGADADGNYYSHVSTLWPSMAIILDCPNDASLPATYPALELAKAGILTANNWQSVVLEFGPNGIEGMRLKAPNG